MDRRHTGGEAGGAPLRRYLAALRRDEHGARVAALFDFDGTLVAGYSVFAFLQEKLRRGRMSALEATETAQAVLRYALGTLDFEGLLAVGARHARAGAALFEDREHRQDEGRGLAGAGLRNAEHVAARHGNGDGFGLDGRRVGIAGCLDGAEHFGAESQLSEGGGQKAFSVTAFNAGRPISGRARSSGSAGFGKNARDTGASLS